MCTTYCEKKNHNIFDVLNFFVQKYFSSNNKSFHKINYVQFYVQFALFYYFT